MTDNQPSAWSSRLPRPAPDGHKYDRGHCIIVGGETMTGATRLAAESVARIGAGLVSVVAPGRSGAIYRTALPAHILIEDILDDRTDHFADARRNVLVLGPGFGDDADNLVAWLAARQEQRLVLDADGLNALNARPEGFQFLREGDVLTPHAGEYKRLFGDVPAQEAARRSGCVIVRKGAVTTITDGNAMITNNHASPYLATAGTGDVLAGMIAGLIAQGMPSFEASCAAVWMHGDAALQFGPGLVASDLPALIPGILKSLAAA